MKVSPYGSGGQCRTEPVQARTSLVTLGLLVDRLDDNYSSSLAFAFREEIESRGLRGICFVGHELSEERTDPSNLGYELASPHCLDGLIVGTLGSSQSAEAELRFLERYADLPRCTYSTSVVGVPRVSVDHTAGMKAAVAHLIVEHGHRRIAFIRGPQSSLDAKLRYQGYCSALSDAGLAVEDVLVVQGAFTANSATEAVRVLLDERKLGFDALVASNDAMAAGAMDELVARGIRVPRDVAVVGFDDVEDSRFARPPISSVRHPWRAQAMLAMDLILAQLAGKEVTESPVVASDFVARGSCGCGVAADARLTARESLIPSLVEERDWLSGWAFTLLRHLGNRHIDLDQAKAGQLVHCFWGHVSGGKKTFLPLLEQELSSRLALPASLAAWYAALSHLREDVLKRISGKQELQRATHELTHAAFQRISYAAERQQALRRFRVEQQGRWLALTGERTINAFEPERVSLALREPLRAMGIDSCFVARFDSAQQAATSSVHLVIACESNREYLKVIDDRFSACELLPRDIWPQRAGYVMVLEILQFRGVPLGYALFELGPHQGTIYRGLAERLAAALKGADLAREAAAQASIRQQQEKQRVERELKIAREVQQWILPSRPLSTTADVAAQLLSGQGNEAAYYDVLAVGSATWLCVGLLRGVGGNSGLMVPVLQSVVASLCQHNNGATVNDTYALIMSVLQEPSRPQAKAIDTVCLLIARYESDGCVELTGQLAGAVLLNASGEAKALNNGLPNRGGASSAITIQLKSDESLLLVGGLLDDKLAETICSGPLLGSSQTAQARLNAVVKSCQESRAQERETSLLVIHQIGEVRESS